MSRTLAVQLVGVALVASLLALFAACAPVATPTPSATPTATSTPAPTPTPSLVPTPTAAFNPFAAGTPTPPPTPTATPTISVAPTSLPPADRTPELERRLRVIGLWSPEHPGTFLAVADGWAGGRHYAFLGTDNRLELLEIEDGGPPRATGVSLALPGRPHGLVWEGDILLAVVSAPDSTALQVWDVSDVTKPRQMGSLPGVEKVFDLDGRRAYVSRYQGPGRDVAYLIPDVARPEEAVELEGFDRVTGVTAAGDLAYVFWSPVPTARNVPRITAVDVSPPGGPRVVGELEGVFATRGALAGDRLWLWGDSWGLTVLDVSDASQPRILSEPPRGPRTISTMDTDDSVLLLADGTRLYLLLYGGDWGVYRWQLQALDISDPSAPEKLGSVEGEGVALGMWFQGEQMVVADWYGMSVADVSDPMLPREVTRVPSGGPPVALYLRPAYAYLFLQSGLFVLDLFRPDTPQLAASRNLGRVMGVHDYGDRFRVSAQGAPEGCDVHVSDPRDPKVMPPKSDFPPDRGQTVSRYFYWAGCGSLMVEDPSKGRGQDAQVARIRLADSICAERWHLAVVGENVYVVGNGKLYLFDASDPNSPKLIAEKPLAEGGEKATRAQAHVTIADGRAYVLHGGLWVLDVADPLRPQEIAYYPTDALSLDVERDRLALLGPDGTFELLKTGSGH